MIRLFTLLIFSCLVINSTYATIVVGTTGDYAPFSHRENGEIQGVDIDLFKRFAKDTNQHIKIVDTSWKDAEQDLRKNAFDVFIGGMTITPSRQQRFVFSKELKSFNKKAMTLCSKTQNYNKFEDIDNKDLLIIENRGGTNEKFALENITNAKVLIVNNNLDAINSLEKGIAGIQPDIMITDSIEIEHIHKNKNPKICKIDVEFDKNISYKAFMFNKDKKGQRLAKQFNNWLDSNPKLLEEYKSNLS